MKKKSVFPGSKKIGNRTYFLDDFTFSKDDAQRLAKNLRNHPKYRGRILVRVIQHWSKGKLWGIYMHVINPKTGR